MDIKEYLMSLLKYKSNGNGLKKNATIIITDKSKKKSGNKYSSPKHVSGTNIPSHKEVVSSPKKSSKTLDKKNSAPQKDQIIVSKNETNSISHIIEINAQSYEDNRIAESGNVFVPYVNKDELSKIYFSEDKMLVVGLDFGTHQTKVCIECKGGVELSYTFLKFNGPDNCMHYTLPSIIGIDRDNKLHYGYLPKTFEGKIIRYYKQTVFRGASHDDSMTQNDAYYYSIWYIAYILFELEDVFGPNFSIQMGAPTDSIHVNTAKKIATRIIASAYKLVEEVFANDKDKFLSTDLDTLKKLTEIETYSHELKESYGLLVFPEAYACLKPLTTQKKIKNGYMNLMIDIGGGTTDISFFTTQNDKPQLYDFFSINKGLNFLTFYEGRYNARFDSNVKNEDEIDKARLKLYIQEIRQICCQIEQNVIQEFKKKYPTLYIKTGYTGFMNRPLVYTGGGSTFSSLRLGYGGFLDIKQISESEWNTKAITQIKEIKSQKLFPVLSTAYGLAISTENDNIPMTSYNDFFKEVVPDAPESRQDFNYTDDYSAIK